MRLITTTLGDEVREQLASATHVRIAVAYFNPNDDVVDILRDLPNVTLLVGSEFTVNNPYKLERLAARHEVLRIPADSNGRLHAKVFLFDRDDGTQCGIIGSANFTSAGLGANREAAVLVESSTPTDRLLLSDLNNWFVATRRDARSISFDLAKQIFDRSSRREVDSAIQEHGNAWILKTHPGSDEVDYWSRFLAEGVVAIGWEDLDGNPSKVEDDKKLEDAIRQAYPPTEERKRNYRYIREVMRDFVSWANGDLVLLCRGYPGNGNSPVHVNGFARIVGPFYDDAASDWWRFKHRAEIQVVDGKLPRRQMAEALGMRSLLGTLHPTDVDALHRVAGLCKEFLDVSLTF